jgi:hypothetical protein
MTELNKFQQEIENLLQKADKATDKRLYNLYIDTIKDLKKSLLVDYQRLDALTSSQKLKLSQMSTLLEQLDQSADKLKKGLRSEITGHLIDTGKIAYNELFYEFDGGHGGINFAMLKEEELRTVIETPVANFKLSERLNDGVVERLKNNIKDDLNRIFLHGASYAQASARLAEQGYSSYRRAMTITRTEAGRVQAVAREKAQTEARNLGVEFDKVWIATLDGRTRHNHAELDGAQADKDGYFEINGLRTKQPHMFGFASEDVNCRCRTISRLKDDDALLSRRDNETGKIIEHRNYREWAEAKGYKEPANKFQGVITDVDFSKPRRTIAKKILENLGIDDIPVSIKKIGPNGYCRFDTASDGTVTMTEYVLDSKDQRSSDYQIKTTFHEAYHAMNHGRKSDMKTGIFGDINWLDIEETFAETSAHYAIKQAGIDAKLSPAYPDKLVNVLPRLKQLDKFKNASTLSDFGEVAWNERLTGQASTWESLAKEVNDIQHDWVSYGKQYEKYIKENETDLLGLMLQNMPRYDNEQIRGMMLGDLHSALDKAENGRWLNSNEEMVYSNILVVAMNLIGVK